MDRETLMGSWRAADGDRGKHRAGGLRNREVLSVRIQRTVTLYKTPLTVCKAGVGVIDIEDIVPKSL